MIILEEVIFRIFDVQLIKDPSVKDVATRGNHGTNETADSNSPRTVRGQSADCFKFAEKRPKSIA